MKKISLKIEKSPEGDYWASSPDAFGFFAYGDTRDEAIQNALEGLSLELKCDESEIELIFDENPSADRD